MPGLEPYYLIVDPLGEYAERFVTRLAARGRKGIAVFSDPIRQKLYEHRFAPRFGTHLVGTYGPETIPIDVH